MNNPNIQHSSDIEESPDPGSSNENIADMDFGVALQFLATVADESDGAVKDDIVKASTGDTIAIESLIKFTEEQIRKETNNGADVDMINKLVVAKIALEAHEETLKQTAFSNAAFAHSQNVAFLDRSAMAEEARIAAADALGNVSDDNTGTIEMSHEEGNFSNKQKFNEILYGVGNKLGLDSPSSLLGVSFDDMLPKQREAVYDILEGALNQAKDPNLSHQTLFFDTKNAIDSVMNGVNNASLGTRNNYSLASQ